MVRLPIAHIDLRSSPKRALISSSSSLLAAAKSKRTPKRPPEDGKRTADTPGSLRSSSRSCLARSDDILNSDSQQKKIGGAGALDSDSRVSNRKIERFGTVRVVLWEGRCRDTVAVISMGRNEPLGEQELQIGKERHSRLSEH